MVSGVTKSASPKLDPDHGVVLVTEQEFHQCYQVSSRFRFGVQKDYNSLALPSLYAPAISEPSGNLSARIRKFNFSDDLKSLIVPASPINANNQ